MKRPSLKVVIIVGVLLISALFFIYLWSNDDKEQTDIYQVTLDEKDLTKLLPMTKVVEEDDTKPETIAYRLWFDAMDTFKQSGQLAQAYFTRFHKLEGNDQEFVVAVIFEVQLGEGVDSTSWGKVQENGMVEDLVWKLRIKKTEEHTYTLEQIEKSTDTRIGLPPVQDESSYKKEAGIEEPSEEYRYEVDDTLKITYNNGEDWIEVPVAVEDLFQGDVNGTTNELLDRSYVIQPERTAFVIGGLHDIRLLLTTDKGDTWDEILITNEIQGARLRLLGFTSEQDGYLIVTGYRTMSSEGHFIFKTNDGGQSWYKAGSVEETQSLVTGGGFVNDELGFISFGSYNFEDEPSRPYLFRTIDGGSSWEEVVVPIPDEYKGIFTVAEIPVFNGEQGTLLVNQGPTGDYLGGKVLAEFTSTDKGKTWSFTSLVDVDGVIGD